MLYEPSASDGSTSSPTVTIEYGSHFRTLELPLKRDHSIVAIHGIGAHPDDTWCKNVGTDREGRPRYVNWLEDAGMLPSIVPDARIMRYGYESQWFGDDKVDTVRLKASTVAQLLLQELNFEREAGTLTQAP